MRRTITTIAAVAALALTACGGGTPAESNDEKPAQTSERERGSASAALEKLGDETKIVQNRGGSQAGSNLNLPDGFPDDVTLPANMNVISTSTPLPNTQMIMGVTPSMPDAVLEEIRANLTGAGWSEAAFQQLTPQMAKVDFEKDGRMANVTITQNGDTSMVQLMTGPKIG